MEEKEGDEVKGEAMQKWKLIY
ncbi:Protein of unknown function [Bacillus toyonensis]|nr:Protein of unknown function [Bacillus toyonensis]